MFEKSVPTAQIASELQVSEKSVRLWRRRWTTGGTAHLGQLFQLPTESLQSEPPGPADARAFR
ncbi:helix-turn-helix domain-containing protein [Micromonospora sp. STR1s_5]|nr:helix-turn-helix domain-containing protein [Micromonospora sp. STR1s_5]